MSPAVSVDWTPAGDYEDIRYELSGDGIAKITIARPEVRNAFRPQTLIDISDALTNAREDGDVGVIILTGEGIRLAEVGWDRLVAGIAATLIGLLWIGQGTGVIQWPASSFMLDQRPWALRGLVLAVVGLGLIVWSRRNQKPV